MLQEMCWHGVAAAKWFNVWWTLPGCASRFDLVTFVCENYQMSTSFNISPEFCIPFVLSALPSPDALNSQLKELFIARESEGSRYQNVGALVNAPEGLFESTFRLFDWPDPCVQQLRTFCWQTLYRAVGELNGYDAEILSRLKIRADAWFHITRKGGYFGLHNHPNASWSGVYCVSAGHEPAPESDSGKLQFCNPMMSTTSYVDMANARFLGRFAAGARSFRLVPGQIVLFPSWVPHQVLPFHGEGERITVAFNAQFKLDGPVPPLK